MNLNDLHGPWTIRVKAYNCPSGVLIFGIGIL